MKLSIWKTSVLISSKIWTIEHKQYSSVIAVAVAPVRKGKCGRVDDVCYTRITLLFDQEHESCNGCSVMSR